MRILVLAAAIGMMGGAAGANVITITGTGVFDLVETGIGCDPCGPAGAAPARITRSYTMKLNDEVGELRWFGHGRDVPPGETFGLAGSGYGYRPPEVMDVNINSGRSTPVPGYRFDSAALEYSVVLVRGPALGTYALDAILITGATVSDRWDSAVIGGGASEAYLDLENPEAEIARYSGTVDWTLDVAPIPVPAAGPLLATAAGLLVALRRRRRIPS